VILTAVLANGEIVETKQTYPFQIPVNDFNIMEVLKTVRDVLQL